MASANKVTQAQIEAIVAASRPERLSDPGKRPITGDHAANVAQLTAWGQTTLAADHLLFPELNGCLPGVVAGVIRQLNIRFAGAGVQADDEEAEVVRKVRRRQYAYETLLEMGINFCGLESRWLDAA
ncbi:MAG: Transaldolase, partial [candidate division NC10 bacterium]|nr:Transaldolase [candidate division NC10 bacterium]